MGILLRLYEDSGALYASKSLLVYYNDMSLTKSRESPKFLATHGKRKAFHLGSNLSCQSHICQHYELYKVRCALGKIPEHHHAIPRVVWKAMEAQEKELTAKRKQSKINDLFNQEKGPRVFSREDVLHVVTKFIACDDQVNDTHQKDLEASNHLIELTRHCHSQIKQYSGTV